MCGILADEKNTIGSKINSSIEVHEMVLKWIVLFVAVILPIFLYLLL